MDLFDIIGPIMTGPSSSHTAGAARMGLVARELLGEAPVSARVTFSGSFADTYKGHGTDRAIAAGLMGMAVDDIRIRSSLSLARETGFDISFECAEIPDAHPNTALIDARGKSGARVTVRASSVGGGAIRVDSIDSLAVSFRISQDTIVVKHIDAPGVIASVSGTLSRAGVNIATMQVFRESPGGGAIMAIEIDAQLPEGALDDIRAIPNVTAAAYVKKF